MSILPNILRLLLLLLTPLWLSLAADALGVRWSLTPLLSGWLHADKVADPALLPPPGWREGAYLAANPDVAAAVRSGVLPSGYAHYVQIGRAENRRGGFAATPTPAAPQPIPAPVAAPVAAQAPTSIPAPAPETPAKETPAKPAPTAALVSRIRTGNSDDAVRILLDVDQPPRFDPPVREPDGSLAVTLPGARWQAPATGRLLPSTLAYRAETIDGATRLSITGSETMTVKAIFSLPPEGNRGHRLVIDVVTTKGGKAKQPPKAPIPDRSPSSR